MKLSRQPIESRGVLKGRLLFVQSTTDVPEAPGGGRLCVATVLDPERPIHVRAGEMPLTTPAERIARIFDRIVEENEQQLEAARALAEERGFEAIGEMFG